MLFTQIEFLLLFPLIWGVLFLIRSNDARKITLLAISLYLYGYWDWRFVGLLLFCAAATHFATQAIAACDVERQRKRWLWAGVTINLVALGVFKYFDFFVSNLNVLLESHHLHLGALKITLPVGISFFTFQLISYCVDVYRKEMKPTRRFHDLLLYISFFPHVFAGPIVRARFFLPQLEHKPTVTLRSFMLGFCRFIIGMFSKVFIADRLSYHVEAVFNNWSVCSGLTIFLGVLAFATQIFCDFAGYTDMAIGLSRMLGYELCENFYAPYLATSISDFWRRWHVSLSTWLRDYIYIPLGGNRGSAWRTYLNLMITMMLGGLWHGPSWTYVVWGTWHGLALSAHRYLQRLSWTPSLSPFLGWLTTMLVVVVGWVFFRASSITQACGMLSRLLSNAPGVSWFPPATIAFLVAGALLSLSPKMRNGDWRTIDPYSFRTAFIILLLMGLVVLMPQKTIHAFVYFQF